MCHQTVTAYFACDCTVSDHTHCEGALEWQLGWPLKHMCRGIRYHTDLRHGACSDCGTANQGTSGDQDSDGKKEEMVVEVPESKPIRNCPQAPGARIQLSHLKAFLERFPKMQGRFDTK